MLKENKSIVTNCISATCEHVTGSVLSRLHGPVDLSMVVSKQSTQTFAAFDDGGRVASVATGIDQQDLPCRFGDASTDALKIWS
jgi:hypothetical protein